MSAERAISVIIPCRDEVDSLEACLEALAAQDYPAERFEVIVVDGSAGDGLPRSARERGICVLRDGGNGPSAARNLGIRAARAPIVAFTDADCVPRRDWLTRIAEVFAEDPLLDGVGGSMRLPRTTLLGRLEDGDAQLHYQGFITSNVAYRREVLLALGGFDETLLCCEDYDLAWRAMDAGYRVVHDPRPRVLHNPPEIAGTLREYLRKQWWYARNDVPAHARAVTRGARSGGRRPGSAAALLDAGRALQDAALTLAVGGGLAAGSPALAAAGALGAAILAGRDAARCASEVDRDVREVPARVAVGTAKKLVRGAGTLAGLADLARPSRASLLRRPGAVGLVPAAARRARARAPHAPA